MCSPREKGISFRDTCAWLTAYMQVSRVFFGEIADEKWVVVRCTRGGCGKGQRYTEGGHTSSTQRIVENVRSAAIACVRLSYSPTVYTSLTQGWLLQHDDVCAYASSIREHEFFSRRRVLFIISSYILGSLFNRFKGYADY